MTTQENGRVKEFEAIAETLRFIMETNEARMDGLYSNNLTGMGVKGIDISTATQINNKGWMSPLSYNQFHTLLLDSFIHKYLTAIPQDAIQEGWNITLGEEDSDPKLASQIKEYKFGKVDEAQAPTIEELFFQAQYEANAGNGYAGGAALVLTIDDGRNSHEPVDYKNIKSIRGIRLLDCTQLQPDLGTTGNGMTFGNLTGIDQITHYFALIPVEFENVIPPGAKANTKHNTLTGLRIHKSRLLRFDGHRLTQRIMLERYGGWSASKLPLVRQELEHYRTSQQAVSTLIQTASVFIQKVKNLNEILKSKNADDIRGMTEYYRLMRQFASITGGMTVDADMTNIEYVNRNLNGVEGLIKQSKESLIGASNIPHTKLFGMGPEGWGSTGESEEKDWANTILSFQRTDWHSKLKYLYRLVLLAKDGPTKGVEPKGWDISFPSILKMSEEQKANLKATLANVDATYMNMQSADGVPVLVIDEIRDSRFGGTSFGYDITLNQKAYDKTLKAIDDAKKAAEQPQDPQGLGIDPSWFQQEQGGAETAPPSEDSNIPPSSLDEMKPKEDSLTKKVLPYKDAKIGLEFFPGDRRFGKVLENMGYGHIQKHLGEDGEALDVYVHERIIGKLAASPYQPGKIFRISQLDKDGGFDEYKYFLGFNSKAEAEAKYKSVMPEERFGDIQTVSWQNIQSHKKMDAIKIY